MPFDLASLNPEGGEKRRSDVKQLSAAMGLGGILDVDLDYEIKVDRPAYAIGGRHPRVLFDEAHHNWYSAAGSYIPFALLLRKDGYEVIRNRERYNRDVLRKGEILVIPDQVRAPRIKGSLPKPQYTDAECDAIRDWVKDGGALLLISNAPPQGGSAGNLARLFGVDLSNRLTFDPANSEGNGSRRAFGRQNQLLGDHPITRGRDDSERLDRVQIFEGQSLKGPEGSIPFLKLSDTAIDRVVPSRVGATVDDRANPPVPAAGRARGLAFTFGRGRVVVLGSAEALAANSFVWSWRTEPERHGMNMPGFDNRQMALNIMHWLSGLLEPREAAPKKVG